MFWFWVFMMKEYFKFFLFLRIVYLYFFFRGWVGRGVVWESLFDRKVVLGWLVNLGYVIIELILVF